MKFDPKLLAEVGQSLIDFSVYAAELVDKNQKEKLEAEFNASFPKLGVPSPEVPDFSKMEAWHAEAAKKTPGFMAEKPPVKENPRHPVGATFSMVRSGFGSDLHDDLIEVGSMVCRRSGVDFKAMPDRRVREQFLTVRRIDRREDGIHVGYLCGDYEGKAHWVEARKVRRFSA
jgi:hypothetical protein